MSTPAEFAEIAVQLHGARGIYRESGWLSLVRVVDVSFDAGGARLELEPLAAHGLRSDLGGNWSASSIWDCLSVSPDRWSQPYPSLSIEFNPELVDAVVAFAATLPAEFTRDHYGRIRSFMHTFDKARRE